MPGFVGNVNPLHMAGAPTLHMEGAAGMIVMHLHQRITLLGDKGKVLCIWREDQRADDFVVARPSLAPDENRNVAGRPPCRIHHLASRVEYRIGDPGNMRMVIQYDRSDVFPSDCLA